jgi:spore germination protein Q
MNGNYFQNPTFPSNNEELLISPPGNISQMNMNQNEQSYIENILRLNKGKRVNAYVSYPDSSEWQNKIYSGIIEEAGRDHLIISDPETGKWYLIRIIYLDYVEFMEKINYIYNYN